MRSVHVWFVFLDNLLISDEKYDTDQNDVMSFSSQKATATALLFTEIVKKMIDINICENITSKEEIDRFINALEKAISMLK